MKCYFNMRSKADKNGLNLPHRTKSMLYNILTLLLLSGYSKDPKLISRSTNLSNRTVEDTSPEIHRKKFFEICEHYKGFSRLYTAGCRMEDRVAASVVRKSVISRTTRLPNKVSIFRAELYAISLAMVLIRCSNEKNFISFSDSYV